MKIIAPVNNKGGVGKTKVTTILAEYLSKICKYRVLAIDFDPQCNFSQRFLKMEIDPAAPEGMMPPVHPDYDPFSESDKHWDGRSSIADIFFGKSIVPYPTFIETLDIAPGDAAKLLQAEAVRRHEVTEKVHKQLKLLLNSDEVKAEYDVVIIDTAPSKGPLTVSVIKAATDILIPTIMEEQPIQGVYGMLQLWMQESMARTKGDPLNLLGILPNKYNRRTNLHQQMLTSLQSNQAIGKYIIPVQIGDRIIIAELDSDDANPKSIFDLPENNLARQEAVEFCEFITKRIFAHEEKETVRGI
ncbi:MAG: ParA family protein [Pseudomonadota bacterium]